MDVWNGGAQATEMKVELNDVLERLAFMLVKQPDWQRKLAVHQCIDAVAELANQDPLELARQSLRSNRFMPNDPSSATAERNL